MRRFLSVGSNRVAATTQGIMHNLNDNHATHFYAARWRFHHLLQATLKGVSGASLVWVGSSLGLGISTPSQTVEFSLYGNRAIAQISTPVDPGEATPAPQPEGSPLPGTSPQPGVSPAPPTDNQSPQPQPTNSPFPQPPLQTTPIPAQPPTQPQTIPSPTPTTTPTNPAQPTPTVSPTPGSPTPSPSPSVQISPPSSPTVIPPVSPSLEAAPTPAPEPSSTTQTGAGFPWWIVAGIGGAAIAAGATWALTRKPKPPAPVERVTSQPPRSVEPLPAPQAMLPAPTIPLSEVKFIPRMDRIGHSTVTTPGALGMNFN
ncbi:MAG TPA: hypothetical protein IGS53_04950 [Leptolyngbyaceae cyanobacterium M33_DOE_097]|uniref:Uncharacterized protein n=1 Tax=Oscillatoriales cyanobacterium SpSt-418 TaxID=2282169 RepID=A0A7C3KCS3_9CYAN|nr:hypothetical protein [Leptolyngbyaceae cyanobacterium M33_DOE_097]